MNYGFGISRPTTSNSSLASEEHPLHFRTRELISEFVVGESRLLWSYRTPEDVMINIRYCIVDETHYKLSWKAEECRNVAIGSE